MILTKTYKYRLEPTAEQEHLFVVFSGCRRFVWNFALARKKAHYQQTGKTLCYSTLASELVALKQQPETAFLKQCHSQVLQQTLMDLEKAFAAFFAGRASFPKFKSRKRISRSFRIPQNLTLVEGKVSIPKVGLVKAILHRPTEGEIKAATIKQEAHGHWYVCFVSHLQLPDAEPTCNAAVGVDVGLESFVTLSNGQKVKSSKFYRKAERKLKRLQRQLSRCQKTSKRRQKVRRRLARHHSKVRRQRNDSLHKLSDHLTAQFDTLCIEDLNLAGLARTKLAKSFTDAALGVFVRMLLYKAKERHCQIIQVDRYFASSKTCHICLNKQHLELSDREWQCAVCGSLHDRDLNAAINLLLEGLRILAAGIAESLNANGENIRLATPSSSR